MPCLAFSTRAPYNEDAFPTLHYYWEYNGADALPSLPIKATITFENKGCLEAKLDDTIAFLGMLTSQC